jgi:hypothetical protein
MVGYDELVWQHEPTIRADVSIVKDERKTGMNSWIGGKWAW